MAESSSKKKPVGKSGSVPAKSSGGRGKPVQKEAAEKDILLKELRSLIRQVDEEGLRFLIKQATTIIYNLKVEELNQSRAVAEGSRRREKAEAYKSSSGAEVFFESGKRSDTYILDVDGKRTILDQDELMQMVKIAQGVSSVQTACGRVYRWLKTHRDDILLDCGLREKGPRIDALCERLQGDFAIRE